MHMINIRNAELETFEDPKTGPSYAILSHVWAKVNNNEVYFHEYERVKRLIPQQLTSGPEGDLTMGVAKNVAASRLTRSKGLDYI